MAKDRRQIRKLNANVLSDFRNDRLGLLHRFNRECGDIGRLGARYSHVYILNTPELLHEVLVEQHRSFEKSPVMKMGLFPLAGKGLFTSEGELWKRQRKLMAPIFTHAQIQKFGDAMLACTERTTETWKDGAVIDATKEMTRLTMSIAGKTLFDADTFSEADELGEALTIALDWAADVSGRLPLLIQADLRTLVLRLADRVPARLEKPFDFLLDKMLDPIRFPGRETRRLERALDVLDGRVARMIEERRRNPGREDLLSRLLSAKDDDDGVMSDRQIRDEVLTLFVAGHETTATGLAWSLTLLAKHPDAYARVRAEVDELGRLPAAADLPRLAYTTRVFKEALRMYPPVYLYGRQAIEDVEIGGYDFKKGTIVLVSPYALQRRPEYWPDPERFDPDRFTKENEAARHRSAYLPFSAGPRTCIGNHFALMEATLALATIFHHCDLELVNPGAVVPEPSATLRPSAVEMRVKLRGARASVAPSAAAAN
jgi:cytochrome P450